MKPYAIIDFHCDTLTKSDKNSLNNDYQFSLDRIPKETKWAQFFAVYIKDEENQPMEFFKKYYKSYLEQVNSYKEKLAFCKDYNELICAWADNKCAGFLSVENGNVLEGKAENIKVLADAGVRALTLVWNGENEIGSGNDTQKGLKQFGKEIIPLLEQNNIIIDVSHLNDKGFYDFIKIAKKPFIASHSNSRSICAHKRNLTDDMVKEIVKKGGIIGINYYNDFVCKNGGNYTFKELYSHIEKLISLGAMENIALGSDFDGACMPECLENISKVKNFYSYLIKNGLTKEEADGIFYNNGLKFIENNIK